MVTSCVSAGHGFSLLTPTLLVDGMVENMKLRIAELPVAGQSRTLTLVARAGELQDLPSAVAALSKTVLTAQIAAYLGDVGTKGLDCPVPDGPILGSTARAGEIAKPPLPISVAGQSME